MLVTQVRTSIFTRKKVDIDHSGDSISIHFADPVDTSSYMKEDTMPPQVFPGKRLHEFLMINMVTYPKKEQGKDELNTAL